MLANLQVNNRGSVNCLVFEEIDEVQSIKDAIYSE